MTTIETLINSLSELILYIVYGYVCVNAFLFMSSTRSDRDIEHTLIVSIVVGFIIDHVMKLIPVNISPELDTIGITITSLFLGFVLAKVYRSERFNNFLFTVCKINATTDSYIWDTIINRDDPVLIEIVTQDDYTITGFSDLVEEHTDDPHITLANFKIFDDSNHCIKQSKENETLFFDLKNAKYYSFNFHKNDPKIQELRDMMSNNYSDYK